MQEVGDEKMCKMAADKITKDDMKECLEHGDSMEKCIAECNANMKAGSTRMCEKAAEWMASAMSAEGEMKECLKGGNIAECIDVCVMDGVGKTMGQEGQGREGKGNSAGQG